MCLVVGIDCILFRKCLNCEVSLVCETFYLVDSGETALPQFFYGFVETVEAQLVQTSGKETDPYFYHALSCDDEFDRLCSTPMERKSYDSGEDGCF